MMVLVTDQGTAAAETGLCEKCYTDYANQGYAREMASQSDDVDRDGKFVDCSENDAVSCCICEN